MTGSVQSPYTHEQIATWLKGLLAIAWSDGHFDAEEKTLITSLTELELVPEIDLDEPIQVDPTELAEVLGHEAHTAENFLRTAVMVAIADGIYSPPEDELLHQYCTALKLDFTILDSLRVTLTPKQVAIASDATPLYPPYEEHHLPLLGPVQDWLDQLEIHDPRLARFLCKMIPPQCPFERDVVLFGHKIVHIPAMCKLNPLYDQLVGLRFRALSYLADDCGEDVTPYLS